MLKRILSIYIPIAFTSILFTGRLSAQISEADQYKIDHPAHIANPQNSLRDGQPGSDCGYALPLTIGNFSYLPLVESNLPNIISQGILSGCLASAPNQTWFAFAAGGAGTLNIVLDGVDADYDFILLDGTGFPCEEFYNYSGISPLPEILACSYSASALENIDANVAPNRLYYLIITNFSNMEFEFHLTVESTVDILPINSSLVSGKVYADLNDNCQFDEGDNPVSNTTVLYQGTIVYTTTDADGNYSMLLPAGSTGTIAVSNNNFSSLVWSNNCTEQEPFFSLSFDENGEMIGDVVFSANISCAIPSVESSVPFLRRCFTSARTVQYCNLGTIPTEDLLITLDYDAGIIPVYFSVPFTQDGNSYTVNVEAIPVGGCGSFSVTDSVTCENAIGSFATVNAHISPLSECMILPAEWDGSDLEVTAVCDDSTHAIFTVINAGAGNMSGAMPYEIRRNNALESSGVIQLDAGASQTFAVDNYGDMVTLQVTETLGNPFNTIAWGFSDCGGTAIIFGGTSPGFAINDQQPWFDQDIEPIIGAYDPNDKFAWPFGIGEAHTISRNDALEYRIRFQNTGSDTAFTIVVVDTLSDLLDIGSFRITGNSHPYIYEVDGQVVTITFPQIMLPDSTTNLEGSIGYFRFTIEQREENPLNYQINNFADIYFDFNPPIRTNTAIRSVGEVVTSLHAPISGTQPQVYPVPASDLLNFILPEEWSNSTFTLSLVDMTGRIVQSQNASGRNVSTSVSDLSEGMYFAVFHAKNGRTSRVAFIIGN